MLRFSFFVFLTVSCAVGDQTVCEERCTRLKQRSLSRIGYDDERLQTLFERQRPLESMRDVCWRLYDNLDCMKKCPKSEKHAIFAKTVRNKCRFVLEEMEPTLKCISKHHSFLQMRCSSFLNEASRLRAESDLSTTPRHDECRFLHLTTICLENHVNTFCPDGRKIFRRLNFRDYFLSFVLPMDDDLFDDEDLDSCQIYDFVKDAEKREREETERKQEEERRRRIEDDEDYEEELTTIVNDMEEEEVTTTSFGDGTTTVKTLVTSTESISESESESLTPGAFSTLGTTEIVKEEEFTTLLDELITSAEHGSDQHGAASEGLRLMPLEPEETKKEEDEKAEDVTHQNAVEVEKEKDADENHENRQDLDSLVEKFDGENQNEDPTPSPSPETSPIHVTSPDPDPEHHNYSDVEYSDADHHYDEEYHDGADENSTHPTISVVSIESRVSESKESKESDDDELVEVTTPDMILNLTPPNVQKTSESSEDEEKGEEVKIESTTPKRKVFSEDSMENTPPNFFYSSNRYDITTRSNYVADNLDMQDSEEPLEIDTSTLFGIEPKVLEGPEGPEDTLEDVKTQILPTQDILSSSTRKNEKIDGKPKPWLHGGVIVKPILNFDQLDVDQDENDKNDNVEREEDGSTSTTPSGPTSASDSDSKSSSTSSDSSSSSSEDDFLSEDGPSTNETLIVIGLIALVICLIFLILLLLLAYFCSARSDSYNVQKDEGSPPI